MTENKNKQEPFWKVLGTKPGFRGNWIDIDLDEIELPDGKKIEFEAVRYHNNGVGVAAEDSEGRIILVKSYRYINDFTGWEIPAGTIPPEQHHSQCVKQELKEEAGCEVKEEDLLYLGSHYASIGSSSQVFHSYHAKNVTKVTGEIDENEIIDAKWFTKDEVKEMLSNGDIKDGFSIVVLMKVLYTGAG